MDREQAIAIARVAAPSRATDDVLRADLGEWQALREEHAPGANGDPPAPTDLVWAIDLGWQQGPMMGQRTVVIIDARDGRVLQTVDWIS